MFLVEPHLIEDAGGDPVGPSFPPASGIRRTVAQRAESAWAEEAAPWPEPRKPQTSGI